MFKRGRAGATNAPIAYSAGTRARPTGGATTPASASAGPAIARVQPVMCLVDVT